jgi:hypothetical protein
MSVIVKAFRWLLGGSFGYLQGGIVVAGIVGGVWFYADWKATKKENESLSTQLSQQKMANRWYQSTIATGVFRNERRADANAVQSTSEDRINAQPQTNVCATSPAIVAAFDELRKRADADGADATP